MKKSPEEIVNDIQEACKSLGWNIAMDDSKTAVKGLIIGQPDFVEEVVDQLDNVEDYSIFASDEVVDTELH